MAQSSTGIKHPKANLSSNDSAVLQALFDAEYSPSPASSAVHTDASLPPLPQIPLSELPNLQSRELEAIRPLQSSEITANATSTSQTTQPDRQTIENAIADLSCIISSQPDYASAYVNRAQALRLLIDFELASKREAGDVHTALDLSSAASNCAQLLDDLSRAISLLRPPLATSPVSPLQARILSNAHTHRAYLLYRASRSKPSTNETEMAPELAILPAHLRSLGHERLEEMASWDFQQGGRYGNPVAKQLAVHTNPYAKMCGAIVRDAMKAEIDEWLQGRKGVA
jgi:hypothetical protein